MWSFFLPVRVLFTFLPRDIKYAPFNLLNFQVFEPFGNVELVQLPLDETGHCKGFGFVQVSLVKTCTLDETARKCI